jgi:hypothetical protein
VSFRAEDAFVVTSLRDEPPVTVSHFSTGVGDLRDSSVALTLSKPPSVVVLGILALPTTVKPK